MRTIKFRGKSLATGEWQYGSLIMNEAHTDNGKFMVAFIVPGLPCASDGGDFYTAQMKRVDVSTVGQFTGLYDKNGKEIYEGDIITHGDRRILYVVEWQPLTGLVAKQIGSSSYAGLSYWQPVSEVIGNIYDNPELIKQ